MELLIEMVTACLKSTVVETLNCHSSHTALQFSKSQHVSTSEGDGKNLLFGDPLLEVGWDW